MPIYEFRCLDCGQITETLIGIGSDTDSTIHCKNCGSTNLERILSPTVVSMGPSRPKGRTCCGREERCDKPPCSTGGVCRRD